ncbi:myomegalin isoform X10 [Sinocyclocheilus rhinocerous]|uniref:myomegalin isoform X10 n=1 Tax=Sinocyclocheilus rhinocerous TaxID=307959 RepID=UPI0007B7F13D|nr:PREDICTED: myomegalin-like isoform X10 [Sinocyclocheilus rhinocerous]
MSGFLYRGRHYNGHKAARPKSVINMGDSSSDDAEKSSVLQTHSLREFEQHLNDLKKENFSLKLRIYFLEERFQQKFEDSSSEDVHRRNIELKVEVESLKQELQERQEQLDKALTTAESLTNQNEVEVQRRCEERQQEIGHMQEILETKIQLLQEEAQLARSEAEKMASLADSESQRCLALERRMMMEMQGGNESLFAMGQREEMAKKDRLIEELNETVCRREQEAADLSAQRDALTVKLTQLEEQVQSLNISLQQKEKHTQTLKEELAHGKGNTEHEMQRLIEEQQCQLAEYENAAGQCVSELQKAQQQVQSLQTKIRESEASNKKLQQRLGDMESELRSLREAACGQERTIQTLSDSLNTKDCEITDLHRLIEERKELLRSLKQQNNDYQLQQQVSGVAPSRLQADMSDLQGSLFSAQLELQGLQRAEQQGQRREEDLARANQRLQADLQRALQQHQEGERHNQDLQAALEKVRLEVQQMEEKWRDEWRQREKEVEERERTIRELKTSLEHKERLIEDYSELVDGQKEPVGNRDNLIHKLKQRIQERDRALERAIDDKFTCMEQKEDEVHKLQLLLREKERDLEQLQCVLSNNEETIMSLELLLRGKSLELEQVCEAWRNAQGVQCEREESHIRSLREKDTLISQLQTSLHTRTKEAEEMTAVLLSKVSVGPGEVAEELKSRLQLKERLFQELLSDRSRQTQEHHSQVQDLLNTISAREQYIKDSAGRVGQVMAEQTARLQELRRQLGSANPQLTEADTQTLQDELRLTLRREREAQNQLTTLHATLASHQDQLKTQVSDIEALSRTVSIKEEIIKDLQMQLVDPSDLPLVERLTQELQMLREKVEHQDTTCINHKQAVLDPLVSMETGQSAKSHADFRGFTSDDGEEDDEDCNSEFADSAEDEERSKLTAQSLVSVQSCDQHRGLRGCQDAVAEGPGLAEVKLLVEQKRAVERELMELKSQLEKAGFSSLYQMRKAFFTLRSENEELNIMVTGRKPQNDGQKSTSDSCDGQLVDAVGIEPNERQPMCDQTVRLKSDLEQVQQESRELQERLMVSEATVQAQAEQLKDYRELLTETSVQQDNKQVQVDIQDLGYETCGRSENEAEREETSSPEFDDLELCTSLTYRDGGSQWWGGSSSLNSGKTEHDVTYLQQLVEDLRGQLSQSQALIRSLRAQTRDHTPVSTPRKVNWGLDNSEAQSTAEEDEGWQSSDGFGSLPRQPKQDRELQELVSRVTSLEEQLRKGKGHSEDGKAVNWPGKFDTLIQAQARELSHLRQRMREGRGVCHILTQHLGDNTKTFEELLRSNDIDYYMGQSFRDQLSQSISLAQRVSTKISGRDHSEVPDDKSGHELLAIRLSKELQQKDKLIESLRSKLDQQQRSDTPTSSHALSVATDQSDGTSFVSDDHGSTNEDLELCSELDAASEYGQEQAARSATDSRDHRGSASLHPSNPPSITSSHSHQSPNTCPSMHCTPHRPMEAQAQTGLSAVPLSSSFSFSTALHCPQMSSPPVFDPQTQPLRTCHPYGGGFSLAEVHQELQMLQRQLGNSEPASECYHGPQIKALPAFPLGSHTQPDHSSLHPLSHHAFEQSPFSSQHTSPAMKSGASLLESSAMWDMMYGPRPLRPGTYGDVSSGSSGYQSGHTGTDLMEEHLREIRTLRRRLEDSIQTNDRLRQQLEERLASSGRAGGAPTNIYIQGLDSVTQLSNEIRVLKEENHTLQTQLQQARTDGSKEMERLREVVLSGRGQLKQAELEAGRWADQCRRLQSQVREQAQAVLQLKQEKQNSLDNSTRLQHEVNVLQQQLSECQCLVHTLQCELQVYQRVCGTTESNTGSGLSLTFDLRERESNIHLLEQQLRERLDQCMPHPSARKQLFHDQSPSPPVRDTGFSSHASTAVETDEPKSSASDSSRSGAGALEAEAPDGSFACKTGRHMIGHVDDFSALQQQLLEGKVVIRKIEAALQSSTEAPNLPEGYMRNLHTSTKTLKQILEETSSLLRMFWRAALPSTEASAQQLKKEQPLRKEVVALRRKLSEQEQLLRDTMENLRTSSRTKDSMEQFIVNQLSRTRDVLKQARSNLEVSLFYHSNLHFFYNLRHVSICKTSFLCYTLKYV